MKKYGIEFYDAFGGFCQMTYLGEFDSFEEADNKCNELNNQLDINNKIIREKFSVYKII